MPRDSTGQDMMDGYNLQAIVNAKQGDVRKINEDATAKRRTAESVYQEAERTANTIRDAAVAEAQTKRDRAIKTQDTRVEAASKLVKEAQVALNEFQDKLEAETGVRVPLPSGSGGAGGTLRI